MRHFDKKYAKNRTIWTRLRLSDIYNVAAPRNALRFYYRRHISRDEGSCIALLVNPLEWRGNYSATSNNMKLVHWLLMGWWVQECTRVGITGCRVDEDACALLMGWWYIWYSKEGTGRGRSPSRPLLAVPNVTAHPSAASVPITVLLYIMVRCSAVLIRP